MFSNWIANEKDWKAIWKIKAPGKMNIYLWRFPGQLGCPEMI
jgi:hypothetical protein